MADIVELIGKLLEGGKDGLSAEELAELTSFKPTSPEGLQGKLNEAQGTVARLLEEKKQAKSRLENLEQEMTTLKQDGMSDVDKLQAQLDEMKTSLEKVTADLTNEQSAHSATRRGYQLESLHSGMTFNRDVITPEASRILVEAHLSGLDDLNDADKVAESLKAFQESNKTLFAAQGNGGAGTKSGDGGQTHVAVNTDELNSTVMSGSLQDASEAVAAANAAAMAERGQAVA
jgi:DNA repair exonuclease SbcCD ATPase subunit